MGLRGSDRDRERSQDKVDRLCVDQRYPALANGESGYALEYGNGKFALFAYAREWDDEMLSQFDPQAPADFRWAEINGIGFLCVKFGSLPWGDSPFHPALCKLRDGKIAIPAVGEHKGIVLSIVCVDSITGKIMLLRKVELSHPFSAEWIRWMWEAITVDLTESDYAEKVGSVMRSFTSAQLANAADLRFITSSEVRK